MTPRAKLAEHLEDLSLVELIQELWKVSVGPSRPFKTHKSFLIDQICQNASDQEVDDMVESFEGLEEGETKECATT